MARHPAPPADADNDLLFGLLALQMDFVGRDSFVRAVNAWVGDRSTPLAQVLVAQAGLHEEARALLEGLVARLLEMHGGDAAKSMASLGVLNTVREELRRVQDAAIQNSLAAVPNTCPPSLTESPPTLAHADGEATLRALPPQGSRFRILRPHAKGGLGEVFVARDEELGREVALKQIQDRHADDSESRARFLLEAEITGGLEHPGIVPVYGLGAYADGRPYYAMRFIRGDSLQDAIRRFHEADRAGRDPGARSLELRQLLRRFIDVCNAIAYAHSRGVLHRDIKPANVMLGQYGETLVVDWGLAKLVARAEHAAVPAMQSLRPTSADGATPTQLGSAMGTPAYMSPEQAEGRLHQMGPASDVYSLGATLYCLLTGKPAFEARNVGEILVRTIRGEFPPPRQVKPEVPRELQAVCLRAMALRPEDRYASARDLADDVEHWLADEPVAALPEGRRQRLARWARRHRNWVQAGAAALVLIAVAALSAAFLVNGERRRAELARHSEEKAREEAEGARESEREQRRAAEDALEAARAALYGNQIANAEREVLSGSFDRARAALDGCPAARRRWEWHHLDRQCSRVRLDLDRHGASSVLVVAVSPDGRLLATSHGRAVFVRDARTGKVLSDLTGEFGDAVYGLAFSPDSKHLAVGNWNCTVRVLDALSGKEVWQEEKHTRKVFGVAYSHDGKWVASAAEDNTARLWDARTGKEGHVLKGHKGWLMSAVFSPDGKEVATASGDRTVKLWSAATGEEVRTLTGHTDAVLGVAYNRDGTLLASASRDGTVKIWDPRTGDEKKTLTGHTKSVPKAVFSPDGTRLASVSYDGSVRVWDTMTWQPTLFLRRHQNAVVTVAYSSQGDRLFTGSFDGTVKGWDPAESLIGRVLGWRAAPAESGQPPDGHAASVTAVAFQPGGTKLASAGGDGVVKVWDAAAGRLLLSFAAHNRMVNGLAFSRDGKHLATASNDNTVRVWKADTGERVRELKGHPESALCVAFSADGRRVAAGGADRTLRVWDLESGKEAFAAIAHPRIIESVAYSPDGKLLAAGSGGAVRLWDADTGKEVRTLSGHGKPNVTGLSFSRDGKRLASSSLDETVKVWDVGAGALLFTLDQGRDNPAHCVAFSPDGDRLAVGCEDHGVRLWDVKSRQAIFTVRESTARVLGVAFSHDGGFLAWAGEDNMVRIRNGAPLRP